MSEVEIPFDSIFWNIIPVVRESKEDGTLVELQWGWTAGMLEEDLSNLAEDSPTGYDSVITTIDMARGLRDKLSKIIEEHDAAKSSTQDVE